MINFRYKLPKLFYSNFKNKFVTSIALANAKNVHTQFKKEDPKLAKKYKTFFTPSYIRSLIFCQPKALEAKIEEVYRNFPQIADLFHPPFIFRKAEIDFSKLKLNLKSKKNKEIIVGYKDYLIKKLEGFSENFDSELANYFIELLRATSNEVEIKAIGKRIEKLCNGHFSHNENSLKRYNDWLSQLESIFNYKYVRSNFGIEIIKASDLSVCPYCNTGSIPIIDGKRSSASPDLDHFYPQSKYPFLATSLFNFIPSCGYCNQKFKKAKDTFSAFEHPLVKGARNERLFKIKQKTLEQAPHFEITSPPAFINNIELFELEALYSTNAAREEFDTFYANFQLLKEVYGSSAAAIKDKEKVEKSLKVGGDKKAKNSVYYKLRIDSLSELTDNNYKD